MPSVRVGITSYCNALPLFGAFLKKAVPFDATIERDVPSNLNQKLREGSLDVALISTVEFIKNRPLYTPIPAFGIAASGPVESVKLVLKKPLHDGMRIGLTEESATSIVLLKILCERLWHIHPLFEKIQESNEATLLIGDAALAVKGIDLSLAWHAYTKLPMPFAILAARGDFLYLTDALQAAYAWGKAHLSIIAEMAAEETGLEEKTLGPYLQRLTYIFDEKEDEGLIRFANEAALYV